MKLVLDTNVLVSGTLWNGAAARLLDAILSGRRTVDRASPEALADPDDLTVLACAAAADADAIVTGDDDLLVLRSFAGIPIITVQQALDRLAIVSD